MTQLKSQLIAALIKIQKIPGMGKALQPTIGALKNPLTHVPDGDYENISELKDIIFNEVYKKIHKKEITKSHLRHAKSLIELAERNESKYSKKNKSMLK